MIKKLEKEIRTMIEKATLKFDCASRFPYCNPYISLTPEEILEAIIDYLNVEIREGRAYQTIKLIKKEKIK